MFGFEEDSDSGPDLLDFDLDFNAKTEQRSNVVYRKTKATQKDTSKFKEQLFQFRLCLEKLSTKLKVSLSLHLVSVQAALALNKFSRAAEILESEHL